MHASDEDAATLDRELTVIEGGKKWQDKQENTASSQSTARIAEGLLITTSHKIPSGIGLAWPQVLGVICNDDDTLAIIGSFCLVTLYGSGVAALARLILDRRVSEIREGGTIGEVKIKKITIEQKLLKTLQL